MPPDIIPEGNPEPFEVNDAPLACLVCAGGMFWSKRLLMNTRGLTYMGGDWLNRDALAVVCSRCAFVHWFAV